MIEHKWVTCIYIYLFLCVCVYMNGAYIYVCVCVYMDIKVLADVYV